MDTFGTSCWLVAIMTTVVTCATQKQVMDKIICFDQKNYHILVASECIYVVLSLHNTYFVHSRSLTILFDKLFHIYRETDLLGIVLYIISL